MTDCIEVRATTDSQEAAQKIAEALVSQAEEWAISAKTTADFV